MVGFPFMGAEEIGEMDGGKLTIKEKRTRRRGIIIALRILGVNESEIISLGLKGIKRKAKKNYHKLVFQVHPDTAGRRYLRVGKDIISLEKLKRCWDQVKDMKYMPVTWNNINSLLEMQKGYKTKNDIDLPIIST